MNPSSSSKERANNLVLHRRCCDAKHAITFQTYSPLSQGLVGITQQSPMYIKRAFGIHFKSGENRTKNLKLADY